MVNQISNVIRYRDLRMINGGIGVLLSVVMPVYNAEKRLELAVGSVLNQTWRDLELILVDDGSKDASGEICDRIAASDPRVTVVHQSNAGVSAARNRGMGECRGEYIAFIDADDTIDSLAYEQAMRTLIDEPADLYVFGMSFDYYRNSSLLRRDELSIKKDLRSKATEIGHHFFELYECNYLSSSCNKVYRAEMLKENGIQFSQDMAILEDFKFCLDVLQHCKLVIAIPDVFYRYYHDLSANSFSKRPAIDYMNNFRILDKTLRELADFAGLNDDLSAGRINAMILRYYIYALEKMYSSSSLVKEKKSYLSSFLCDECVMAASRLAVCSGIQMKLVCALIMLRKRGFLHLLFTLNAFHHSRKAVWQ